MLICFIQPLILKTTIIVLMLKYFSVISANTRLPADIYQRFKIKNFAATVVESTILISWNIEPEINSNRSSDPVRPLTIYKNNQLVSETSITIENYCKVNGVPVSVTCKYIYPKEDCMNYKFSLGNKNNNVAYITTVSEKTNTMAFELTGSETNLVKLNWKIECAANYMHFFSNNPTNNSKSVGFAVCNSALQICESILSTTFVCTTPIINIGGETFSFNTEILYSMSNFSIDVSNLNQIDGMEWMETVKIKCPVPSSSFNYNLVIKDNEKNEVVNRFSVPNRCLIDKSPRNSKTRWRKLTFSKNGKISSCPAKTEYFVFNNTQLRPCVNYSVSISGSGNVVNSIIHTSFMIRTLEAEDIKNLHVVSLSSSRFELEWEIPADCLKVKNFTIPIENDYKSVENLSLSVNNTNSNDTACTVRWMYNDLAECTSHAITVSRSTIHVTTPPPGAPIFIIGLPKNSTSTNFEVEWNLPRQCQGNLTIQKLSDERNENSSFIGSAPAIPSRECNKYCHTRWRFDKELEPCTTYQLTLGVFTQEITTLPDISGGIVNEMTIRSKVPESADEPVTLVILWDHPHCKKTKDLKWKISIRKSLSNETIVKPISNLEYSYKYAGVKACETYTFAILTVLENGSTLYSTEEKNFQADCPTVKLLVPISVIVGLLLIAITIALFLCKKRKKMEKDESEHNVNKRTSIESRGRAPSMNHSKLLSFNHNRISCASRNSCNSRNSSSEYAEMDLDCLPQMTKRPLNIRDICSFDVGQARMEFFLINKLAEIETKRLPRTIAERPENKMKNRFLNTHPYDFNRVLLSHSGDDQNDGYINASFIPGFAEKEKEYIAAQGPKDSTLVDFWQMILEQDVRLIAMVTSLYECGKKKCEKYWPSEDELVIYGDDTQLELLSETTYSFYTIRNILVTKAPDVKREIQQFHFTAWPDFETPDQPEELIRFIEIVRRQARQCNLSSPIVVHCSAGVGRTGTFIALDYLIQQVLITDLVDIPKTVRHLRRFRLSMVQSEAQYIFLYSCIAHYVKTRLSQAKEKN